MTPSHIYIDGVRRQVVARGGGNGSGEWILVDSDELPRRACNQHRLDASALTLLKFGSIRTGGHTYSLNPPRQGHKDDRSHHPRPVGR